MKGNDLNGYDFECGNCEKILATGLFHQQIRNIVFVCEKCGNHSIIKFDWKVYILKYIREKIDYSALAVGFFLMLVISTINISNQTKLFLDIAIFIISLNYKYLIQVFQETK